MTYYYPLELEVKMINALRIGNYGEAEEILMKIRVENECRDLDPAEENRVIRLLWENFKRFMTDMQIESEELLSISLLGEESGREQGLWDELFDLLHRLSRRQADKRSSHTLGRELVEYVDANYTSSLLSQQEIADHFRISRPMVSKIFKETAQMNFVDYLHKKRVEHAKLVFDQGESDVTVVAEQVGYENEVTFKRAFVKNEGITPRGYVKMMREKRADNL